MAGTRAAVCSFALLRGPVTPVWCLMSQTALPLHLCPLPRPESITGLGRTRCCQSAEKHQGLPACHLPWHRATSSPHSHNPRSQASTAHVGQREAGAVPGSGLGELDRVGTQDTPRLPSGSARPLHLGPD